MASNYDSWSREDLLEELQRLREKKKTETTTFSLAITRGKLKDVARALEKKRK
jgi:hypothetical protein